MAKARKSHFFSLGLPSFFVSLQTFRPFRSVPFILTLFSYLFNTINGFAQLC